MALSKEQEDFYRQTLSVTRQKLDELGTQIEEELAKVRERLSELQNQKEAAKQVYDGVCRMLGIENDFEKAEVAQSAALR